MEFACSYFFHLAFFNLFLHMKKRNMKDYPGCKKCFHLFLIVKHKERNQFRSNLDHQFHFSDMSFGAFVLGFRTCLWFKTNETN